MTEVDLSLEELVGIYLKIRNAIEAKEEQHKAELQELKDQFEVKNVGAVCPCGFHSLQNIFKRVDQHGLGAVFTFLSHVATDSLAVAILLPC